MRLVRVIREPCVIVSNPDWVPYKDMNIFATLETHCKGEIAIINNWMPNAFDRTRKDESLGFYSLRGKNINPFWDFDRDDFVYIKWYEYPLAIIKYF